MSISPTNSANHASNSQNSEVNATQETLFLLSISRDEDDAAALRSDLKRSPLSNYKIQHCANLDDALHLMRVCGFDLVFIRLDDYKDKQTAVDLLKKAAGDQTIIALATSRLLATAGFAIPEGIDSTCRIEDLSPSLVSTVVTTALDKKKEQKKRERLENELRLALDASRLGLWKLEIESGRIILDALACSLMDIPFEAKTLYLDDALDYVYSDDKDMLKLYIENAIDTSGPINVIFRLNSDSMPLPKIELSGKFSHGSPHESSHFFGVARRSDPTREIYERITSANSAIQRAMDLRDDAIQVANKELLALAQELKGPETEANLQSIDALSESLKERIDELSKSPIPKIEITVSESPIEQTEAQIEDISTLEVAEDVTRNAETTLEIDKQVAFQNVLKSISNQSAAEEDDRVQETFPFDFSTEKKTDYSEPDPQSEGFIGAVKRLVGITQKAHDLFVTLTIDDHDLIESDYEKELLFEILKELLTNVVKHARANECIISLFRDEDEWVLQVEDDGSGLENNLVSISSPLKQMGLFRIRTKLALKGGQLDMTPSFPNGLIARARLPVKSVRKKQNLKQS